MGEEKAYDPRMDKAVPVGSNSPRMLGQVLDCQDTTFELLKVLENKLECVSIVQPQSETDMIGGYHIENAYNRQKRINQLLDNLIVALVV